MKDPLPRLLAEAATLIAGRKRLSLRDEWRAHLSGESGHDLGTQRKTRDALGFAAAGVRFRLADAADLAWRPVDTVLRSRILSILFVWGPVALMLVAIMLGTSRYGLVADVQGPAALGAFLYTVIGTARWWRGVKLPESKTRAATAKRAAPSATSLLAVAAWLLPAADRARYAEECQSELWEIAHTCSRWAQLAYAARQVLSAFRLRRGLQTPPRRGAAP
jgi:hypothetical protein